MRNDSFPLPDYPDIKRPWDFWDDEEEEED